VDEVTYFFARFEAVASIWFNGSYKTTKDPDHERPPCNLIKAYAPQAKTPAFTSEGDKFRNYASAWCDRWNSVMGLFMAGGNYAASGVPFPNGFAAAVEAEIAAAKYPG